jgi:predicted esterase
MLPGVQGEPQDFVRLGFVDALERASPGTSAVLVDCPMEHFGDASVAERLLEEVVTPAHQRGCSQVWLLGISLGGLAALAVGAAGARAGVPLAGIVALSPYLGLRSLLAEIEAAGGPPAWAGGPSALMRAGDATDLARAAWAWAAGQPSAPPIYLGYGRSDRFARSQAALARLLPADRVSTIDGGHDWPVYQTLWAQWLARGLLPNSRQS